MVPYPVVKSIYPAFSGYRAKSWKGLAGRAEAGYV